MNFESQKKIKIPCSEVSFYNHKKYIVRLHLGFLSNEMHVIPLAVSALFSSQIPIQYSIATFHPKIFLVSDSFTFRIINVLGLFLQNMMAIKTIDF